MAQTSSPNNGKGAVPSDISKMHTEAYEQDSVYYYPDGGVVFLAEGVLFRLQASLILPLDSALPTSGDEVQRHPLNVDRPARLTDSNDTNPVVLNVTANQFRTYLFAVLGRPSDEGYLAFLTDAKYKEKHSRGLLIRYLDIADLSWQFGMNALELWAVSQLELILESAYTLAESIWCTETLLRLSSRSLYHKDRSIRPSTLSFIEYFISIWMVPVDRGYEEEVASSNLKTCVELYQDHNLRRNDPTLFGCAFAAILSLGHRSATWTSKITREEKATLYAAQVQLVSLSSELESVEWLHNTKIHSPERIVCDNCSNGLRKAWKPSFGSCGNLSSSFPLKDVTALARLPQYRKVFLDRWNSLISRRQHALSSGQDTHIHCQASEEYAPAAPSSPPGWFSSRATNTVPTPKATCELELPPAYIDECIQRVYLELAERYSSFAEGD